MRGKATGDQRRSLWLGGSGSSRRPRARLRTLCALAVVSIGPVTATAFSGSAAAVKRDNARAAAVASARARPRLIWHDEFNGPNGTVPKRGHWKAIVDGKPDNQELEYYTSPPANGSLNGHGDLAITARRQADGGLNYTSCKLETLGRFQVKYGRIEARIKVPAGVGLWPAFWMLGANYPKVGWPGSGELDIMEMQGNRPQRLVATLHGPAPGSPRGQFQINKFYNSAKPLSDAFHVYGLDWTRNQITWSIDGHVYGTVRRSDLKPGQTWVFNQPYFLVLNIAVGGFWVGPPDATTHFPAKMLVDWVRVYS